MFKSVKGLQLKERTGRITEVGGIHRPFVEDPANIR